MTMISSLPYIPIDEEIELNLVVILILLSRLSENKKKNLVLDFEKIQIFMYLMKNPSKINKILMLADKPSAPLDERWTHTIESMSSNVDILFNREKVKVLVKRLAALGFLRCSFSVDSHLLYALSDAGLHFSNSLFFDGSEIKSYVGSLIEITEKLKPLQAQSNSKIYAWLNSIFKGN